MIATLPLLLTAALGAAPAPAPRTATAWVLGRSPAPGAFATYDAETRGKTYTGDLSGAGQEPKEVELVLKTRVTFLFLGTETVEGARAEWLELQEELVAAEVPGMPAGAIPQGPMVTRVLLAPDGRMLKVVSQPPGRPAEESTVGASTSVAVGALHPFGELAGPLATASETVQVAGLGAVAATTYESSGPEKVKVWLRARDGLCLKLVAASAAARTTYALVRAGSGGKTRITGEIRKAPDPEEQLRRMMQEEAR